VCAALVEKFGGELFHIPTAAARRAAADPAFAARVRAGTDRLGWLPPPLVDDLLLGAVTAGLFEPSRRGPLIVQGFPVLVSQVWPWLRLTARYPGVRLAALEIRVAARVLDARRAVTQMVCSSRGVPRHSRSDGVGAEPDVGSRVGPRTDAGEDVRESGPPLGEPRPGRSPRGRPTSKPTSGGLHRGGRERGPGRLGGAEPGDDGIHMHLSPPAETGDGGNTCAACGRRQVPRLLEHPETYAARLRRYRRGAGPTRRAMSAAGTTWHRIDVHTTRDLRNVAAAACAAVVALTAPDPTPEGPRR
jgi:hypothetical protein